MLAEKHQLCYECLNYTRCDWAKRNEPIKGWTATPTMIENSSYCIPSYEVIDCPQFEQDDFVHVLFRDDPSFGVNEVFKHNEAERKLWRAVICRAIRDYATALLATGKDRDYAHYTSAERKSGFTGNPHVNLDEGERFFRSEYFESILAALDITCYAGEDFLKAVQQNPMKFRYGFFKESDDNDVELNSLEGVK